MDDHDLTEAHQADLDKKRGKPQYHSEKINALANLKKARHAECSAAFVQHQKDTAKVRSTYAWIQSRSQRVEMVQRSIEKELEELEEKKKELLSRKEEVSKTYTAEFLSKLGEYEAGRRATEVERRYEEYMEGKDFLAGEEKPLDLNVD